MFRTLSCFVAVAVLLVAQAQAQPARPRAQASQPEAAQPQAAKPQSSKPAVMVNLNTATVSELEALPGVGAKTAARIVDYRQKKGPFKKIEEIMNVQGIGEKSFLKLKPQLTVAASAAAAPTNQQ